MIRLYNTMTGQKEVFKPLTAGTVLMYVCGPTVYDYMHIGNARPMVVFDVVRRYFEYRDYQVTYVQNYTDVDDKIIKKAITTGQSIDKITERYIAEAEKDAAGLKVKPATIKPRATEVVEAMIVMIDDLMTKGYAYQKEGTVFYDTAKFTEYGKLSGKKREDLLAGSRVAIDNAKRQPTDFVLWKPKKEGEPFWSSPWGDGRPGWHIECSTMAKHYLGDQIDIHAGGTDLIFPHHENEIAQSEACTGRPFANYWLHNGFINIDNRKMSKSKNNFFTIRDIAENYSYDLIRFFLLTSHYRHPINFSHQVMDSAVSSLQRIQTGVLRLDEKMKAAGLTEESFNNQWSDNLMLVDFHQRFIEVMDNDINTADALTVIFDLIRHSNSRIEADAPVEELGAIGALIEELAEVLGINLRSNNCLLDEQVEALIAKRQQARRDKDYQLADTIREQLAKQGIVLEDTREGVRYRRSEK